MVGVSVVVVVVVVGGSVVGGLGHAPLLIFSALSQHIFEKEYQLVPSDK